MKKQKETLKALEMLLAKIETDINRARLLIGQMGGANEGHSSEEDNQGFEDLAAKLLNYNEDQEVKVIEGVYDGYFMIGSDGKKYPVPLNYASKTKLISGDVLKLRILQDGKLMYKLIGEAPRKFIKATFSKTDDSKYIAITDDGKTYFLNQAAATFFKGKPGDELSIIVNADGNGDYAAIEALIPAQYD